MLKLMRKSSTSYSTVEAGQISNISSRAAAVRMSSIASRTPSKNAVEANKSRKVAKVVTVVAMAAVAKSPRDQAKSPETRDRAVEADVDTITLN